MNLEKKQADMRRRIARRQKAEQNAKRRARPPVPQDAREFQILYSLYCYANHTASLENLRLSSAHGNGSYGGRGGWVKTFWELDATGKLEWITIRGRDFVRLTKTGRSFVISHLAQHYNPHQPS